MGGVCSPRPYTMPHRGTEDRTVTSLKPCIGFNGRLDEALALYERTFPSFKQHSASHMPDGSLLMAEFEIAGQPFQALNRGPEFIFTEAVSFSVTCEDQAEVDRYWGMLTADGGEESMCGWLKDRFGMSWQIIPRRLAEMMGGPDGAATGRMFQAMLKMRKLDIAELERAYGGK